MNALKARRAKDKIVRPQNVADDDDADELDTAEYSVDEAAQDVEYLKMTTYDKTTAKLIEEKLKLTSAYRHNLLDRPGVIIVKQFPYMITHPDLVWDFHLNSKLFHSSCFFRKQSIIYLKSLQILLDYSFMHSSNCSTFTEKWPIYSKYILATLALYEKDVDFFTCFSSDIESMLALLKLVTPKPKGRSGKRNNNDTFFQTIVDDFIIFLPV